MPRILACLDEVPAVDGSCVEQAWIEVPTSPFPTLTIEDAHDIGMALLMLTASMAALKLIGRAA